ncbi:MAG TPA: protein kinase, partial [Haloferula sp.]
MSPLHSSCPDCGAPLPADSPQSLCPACLLRQALASRTVVAGQESTPPPPPPAPEEIADKFPQFEVTECLGSGGMGVVYKARQKSLDRWVAIKILRPEKTGEEQFAERFAREAQTLARLNHPNIVTVFDYGETGGLFYIVMEFVDGVNLRDLLREGKLEPEQALAIVPPICEALQYAHEKGIVHRDIKPENLLLDRDGRIKIADFGIASLVGARGEASGTPPYMAPEQQEPSTVDHRADIYALGVVLYEMLTGERPAKDLVAPSRKVPMDVRLDQMVMRALDQNPDRRYQTAEEFRTVLETAGAPAPSVPPPVVPAPPPPMPTAAPAKRGAFARLWWLFLVMLPVGALLGLGVGSVLLSLIPKKYEAKSIVQIRLKPIDPGPRSLVTWVEALKSEKAMNEVATRLNLTKAWMTTDEQVAATLKGIVRTQEIRGTSLLEVSVRFTDPVTAVAIANTTAEVFQERAKDSPGTDSVIIHERAIEPLAPVSPNGRLMLFAAAGIGLAISPIIALVLILAVGRGGSRGCLILGLLISFGAVTASGIWFATRKRTIPPPRSVSTSAAKTPPVRLMATLRIIDMPQERNFPPFKEAMEPDMRVVAVLRTVVETGSEAEMPIPFIPGRDISGGRLPREGSLMISPRLKDGIVSYHLGGLEKSDGS